MTASSFHDANSSEKTAVDKKRRRSFRECMFGTETPDMDDVIDAYLALFLLGAVGLTVSLALTEAYKLVFR